MSGIVRQYNGSSPPHWTYGFSSGKAPGACMTAAVTCAYGHRFLVDVDRIDRDGRIIGRLECVNVSCPWAGEDARLLGWHGGA